MIDIKFVKEQYSKMTDGELISLASSNANELNPEAISALYGEFLKRKLDTGMISSLRKERIQEHLRIQDETDEAEMKAIEKKIWQHCFAARLAGQTDLEISGALVEMGLSKELSDRFVSSIDSRAEKIIKDVENERFISGFVSVLGAIGILFVVVNDLPFKALLFIGMITVLSAIGFFRCYEAMKKMKEVQSSAEPNIDDTV